MQFRSDKPIFQQICESVEEQVIQGALKPEERVPAVREYAVALEVNPNTVVRSFLELEQAGVIFKKRGLGYFVSPDARGRILHRRREAFLKKDLPDFVHSMILLGISPEEIEMHYRMAMVQRNSQ